MLGVVAIGRSSTSKVKPRSRCELDTMPRHLLPHPRPPPPCCPPWRVARWKKHFLFICRRALNHLLAKERRRRRLAERRARQHASKALKLQRRLATMLAEISAVEPVKSDPYLKAELEH